MAFSTRGRSLKPSTQSLVTPLLPSLGARNAFVIEFKAEVKRIYYWKLGATMEIPGYLASGLISDLRFAFRLLSSTEFTIVKMAVFAPIQDGQGQDCCGGESSILPGCPNPAVSCSWPISFPTREQALRSSRTAACPTTTRDSGTSEFSKRK